MRGFLETLGRGIRNPTFLKILAHMGGFVVLFAFFLYLTFPSEDLRVLVERSISGKLGKPVEIESISIKGLSGIELGPTAFAMPARRARSGPNKNEKVKDIRVELQRLLVEGALRSLIQEQKGKFEVELDAYDGFVKVDQISVEPGTVQVTGLTIEGVDLRKSHASRAFSPWDIRGVIDGRGKFNVQKKKLSSGALTIKISDAIVKKPVISSRAYGDFSFSDADLGGVSVKIEAGSAGKIKGLKRRFPAKATVLVVREFEISGADIMATLENEATISWMRASDPVGAGRVSAHFALRLSDSYFERKVKNKGKTEKPNAILRTFMKSDPRIRRATRNGWIGFRCAGTIAKPDCAPVLPSAKVARAKPFAPPSERGDEKKAKAPKKKAKKKAARSSAKGSDKSKKPKFKATKLPAKGKQTREIPNAGGSAVKKKKRTKSSEEDEESEEEEEEGDEDDEDEEEDEDDEDEDDEDDEDDEGTGDEDDEDDDQEEGEE